MKTYTTSKLLLCAGVALALSGTVASAADMPVKAPKVVEAPSPWDIAFGAAGMNDYIFRGITQSAHRPSVAAYVEPRYNITKDLQLYAGLSGESIDFPNHAAAEVDFYGGIRPTFDKFAFDLGVWYYYYPGGQDFNGLAPSAATLFAPNVSCTNLFIAANGSCNVLKHNVSFFEAYGKATYTFFDQFALTGDVYYDPNWLNSGAWGTYASGIGKWTAPSSVNLPWSLGFYVSGEFGHYWFGTTDAFYGTTVAVGGVGPFPNGIKLPGYNTWNFGIGFTRSVFTLDLRYSQTDLSKTNCDVLTSDHSAVFNASNITAINPSGLGSTWCGATFIAKLSFDLTKDSLK
jgi:hypothetical protein